VIPVPDIHPAKKDGATAMSRAAVPMHATIVLLWEDGRGVPMPLTSNFRRR
jgi:hypothetical protein